MSGLLMSQRAKGVPASSIRQIAALVARLPGVVSVAEGEPDCPTPAHIVEAAKAAMDRGATRYTPTLGIMELRAAVAEKARAANRLPADADWVAVTAGATEGLLAAMLATLDPGDQVLIPDPGYAGFLGQARLMGAEPVAYPVQPPDFQVDVQALRHAVTPRTRAILLCTPANPTGGVLRRENLAQVAKIAQDHDLAVLADETYEALLYDGEEHVSIGSLPEMAGQTISVFSFSKTYAMTGWRLGYVVAHPDVIRRIDVLLQHLALCPNSISQHAGLAALRGPQEPVHEMRLAYDRRRRLAAAALDSLPGITCPAPKGAFYVFPDIRGLGKSSDEVADALLRYAGVATIPGTAFNSRGEGFIRISYAVPEEQLRTALDRVAALVGSGTSQPGTARAVGWEPA